MGMDVDANISYGIVCEEDKEFPWDREKESMENWWCRVNGCATPINWETRREFLKKNPLPFELVNYCSGDHFTYILAIPGTMLWTSWGHPAEIGEHMNTPIDRDSKISFWKLINKHLPELNDEKLTWYLSAFYSC